MSRLAEIRKKKLLSQNDLVKLSGVSRSIVTKCETGERDINKASGEILLKLASALTCSIEDILGNMEEIKMERLQELYNEWRKVTEEGIEEYGGLEKNIELNKRNNSMGRIKDITRTMFLLAGKTKICILYLLIDLSITIFFNTQKSPGLNAPGF